MEGTEAATAGQALGACYRRVCSMVKTCMGGMRELLLTAEGPELRTTAWLCWKRRRGLKEAKLKR